MAIWAIVPAAGVGHRMGSAIPKQYLPLLGKTVIERTLERIQRVPGLQRILVVVHPADQRFTELKFDSNVEIETVPGGDERCHSVSNALAALQAGVKDDDWVLVHDAARPCVRVEDITNLIGTLHAHPVGGLLAKPVADTLKKTDGNNAVIDTLDRSQFWHALTPQIFRFGVLQQALAKAMTDGELVTDDSVTVERMGLLPLVVPGKADNIKITHKVDLFLAERIIQQQAESKSAPEEVIQ